MNWWGKLIGTGVGMLGGPIGALAGAAIGHLYDEDETVPTNEQKGRILYLAYFFSCAGKIAKADGHVSEHEITATESLILRFGLNLKTSEFAKNVFRKARSSKRPIENDFKEFARLIQWDTTAGMVFLGGLFEIVRSNGRKLNPNQLRVLMLAEALLKIPSGTVKSWALGNYRPFVENQQNANTSKEAMTLKESFAILDIDMNSKDSEVKKAFRQKVAHFHPDKIKSKNLPEEFTKFANTQLARINQAYENIKKARNLS